MTPDTASRPLARPALVAGIALAAMAPLGILANLFVVGALHVPGDAVATAQAVAGSEQLLRVGVVAILLVALLDIVVAVALRLLFAGVDRLLSDLAAWIRIAYAAVFITAAGGLATALPSADGARPEPDRVLAAFDDFVTTWHAGLGVFGLHLILIGVLAFRSGFVPRVFGVLLAIAGVGYTFDTFAGLLVPGLAFELALLTFVGEIAFIFWLLIGGRRAVAPSERADEAKDVRVTEPA